MALFLLLEKEREGIFPTAYQSKARMDVPQKMGMEEQGDHSWPPVQSFPLGWQLLPQWREESAGVHEETGEQVHSLKEQRTGPSACP